MKFSANKYECVSSVVLLPQSIIKYRFNRHFNKDKLNNLVKSIKSNGIISPITVKYKNNMYEVISGYYRLEAARIIGISTVPCIIMNVSDTDSIIYSVIDNINNSDKDCFYESECFYKLIYNFNLSTEEISLRINKTDDYINNKLNYCNLSLSVRNYIIDNNISEKYLSFILNLDNKIILTVLDFITNEAPNDDDLNEFINNLIYPKSKTKIRKLKDIKIFINTINHTVDTMRESGINALSSECDFTDYYEYILRIPKLTSSPVNTCEAV